MLALPQPIPNSGRPAPTLEERIAETLELMDRRGYGISVPDFGRLLYGGPAPSAEISRALSSGLPAVVVDGLVLRPDRADRADALMARQREHRKHEAEARRLADEFAARLVSTCPLVRTVSLTGSMASGGFDPRDDIDFNLVVRDGAKYSVYLWALALGLVTSLENRRKPTDEMGDLPFLPKVICLNVVWEESQVRPFVRQDKWLAFELMMHRPILGASYWERVLEQNTWIGAHFPQVLQGGFASTDSEAALAAARQRRPGRSLFAWLDRHPLALSVVERVARPLVIGLHKVISLMRKGHPEARAREAFVTLVKRPYTVFDVPGREGPVPPQALRARELERTARP